VGGEFVEAIRWVLGELRARNYVAMFGTWRRCASFDCRLEGGLRSLAIVLCWMGFKRFAISLLRKQSAEGDRKRVS
jgi:hypothetical protein